MGAGLQVYGFTYCEWEGGVGVGRGRDLVVGVGIGGVGEGVTWWADRWVAGTAGLVMVRVVLDSWLVVGWSMEDEYGGRRMEDGGWLVWRL